MLQALEIFFPLRIVGHGVQDATGPREELSSPDDDATKDGSFEPPLPE
jgi:hypothetical protein